MRTSKLSIAVGGVAGLAVAAPQAAPALQRALFGRTSQGDRVELYTLSRGGVVVMVTPFGGPIVSLSVPDRSGRPADVVLGFDSSVTS